ncbi:hypothetical protein OEK97_28645, partial [Escherichia coli]|uniref:hypothetical protein n=1 Tax=Escherichia coli TaxID=562 RepID=UPI0021DA892B
IQFTEDGQHIRKWSREPFEGGVGYVDAKKQRAKIKDLNVSVVAFGAVHAVAHAKALGLPEGNLCATHYDILKKSGGRMD